MSIGFQLFFQDAGHSLRCSTVNICLLFLRKQDFAHQGRLCAVKIKKLSAFLAFCHDADYAARHFYKLLYVRNRANVVKLIQRRIHDFRILLCHQADSLVTDHRLFHSRDRFLSADIKADGHLRKHGKSPEGDHRHGYNLCIFHQVPPK